MTKQVTVPVEHEWYTPGKYQDRCRWCGLWRTEHTEKTECKPEPLIGSKAAAPQPKTEMKRAEEWAYKWKADENGVIYVTRVDLIHWANLIQQDALRSQRDPNDIETIARLERQNKAMARDYAAECASLRGELKKPAREDVELVREYLNSDSMLGKTRALAAFNRIVGE